MSVEDCNNILFVGCLVCSPVLGLVSGIVLILLRNRRRNIENTMGRVHLAISMVIWFIAAVLSVWSSSTVGDFFGLMFICSISWALLVLPPQLALCDIAQTLEERNRRPPLLVLIKSP